MTSALSAVGENGRRSPLSSLGMEEYSPETKPRRDTFSPEPGDSNREVMWNALPIRSRSRNSFTTIRTGWLSAGYA